MFWNRGGPMTLTIDDGPSDYTGKLLDALDAAGHRAVFFIVGQAAAGREAALVETIQRGHALANHSFTHVRFSKINADEARDELLATEEVIEAAYVAANVPRPGKWFRFPYLDAGGPERGVYQAVLAELGFTVPRGALRRRSIQQDKHPDRRDWPTTRPTKDWQRKPVRRFEARTSKARSGDLIEFHDTAYSVTTYVASLMAVLARKKLLSVIPG